jgi:hypothetical protein
MALGHAEDEDMLEQVHDTLWVAEGENVSFFGLPYPTRSVIARLENGDLWVWSPIKLTADLRTEVDRLGIVRHLVSPNKLHHLSARMEGGLSRGIVIGAAIDH